MISLSASEIMHQARQTNGSQKSWMGSNTVGPQVLHVGEEGIVPMTLIR